MICFLLQIFFLAFIIVFKVSELDSEMHFRIVFLERCVVTKQICGHNSNFSKKIICNIPFVKNS